MKSKLFWLLLSCLMVLSLLLVSCGTKTTPTTTPTQTTAPTTSLTTTPTTKPTTTPTNTTGNWWDKFGEPQYGGILTIRRSADLGVSIDPYMVSPSELVAYQYMEQLAMGDWKLDRKIWPFNQKYIPTEYLQGLLAESWEQPDLQTVIFHIRKGVRWQNKPPANGREFTAYDIEYHFHRLLGLGSGYTKRSPYAGEQFNIIASITATDKYTVVFKAKQVSNSLLFVITDSDCGKNIENREAVEKWGNLTDWRNAIGTGPFILDDYVSGSSATLGKNPDYWGYDDRDPKNRLPYIDTLKFLIIPDSSTALAALRTGKIDLMDNNTLNQAQSLAKTNPLIMQEAIPQAADSIDLRCDKAPFTDIKVRKALQMATDLKTIAKTHYGGIVEGTPYGLVGPALPGYFTPFDKWPQYVKEGYTYNPEGAKKLLAEAGYPNGFKTNVVAASNADLDLLQIFKAYFANIGVDMEIRVMDPTSLSAFTRAGKQDQMYFSKVANPYPPERCLSYGYTGHVSNYTYNNDPVFDAFVNKYYESLDLAEQKRLVIEADNYAIAKQWRVVCVPRTTYNFYQPWLKGYSAEFSFSYILARFWVDQDLKKTMGY
jgi:peptide/nickel transport system substrate-binding protein